MRTRKFALIRKFAGFYMTLPHKCTIWMRVSSHCTYAQKNKIENVYLRGYIDENFAGNYLL